MASKLSLKNGRSELSIVHRDGQPAKTIYTDGLTNAVDTIADMEALVTGTDTSAYDGNVCFVKDLDRGGSFIYDSTKVSEDNQGTNFNGWVRQYDGAVNVRWFGANKDRTDNDVHIQAAINYCYYSGEKVIINEVYNVSNLIKIYGSNGDSGLYGTHIIGGGSRTTSGIKKVTNNTTNINGTNIDTAVAFLAHPDFPATTYIGNIKIDGISIQDDTLPIDYAIYADIDMTQIELQTLWLKAKNGIHIVKPAWEWSAKNILIHGSENGFIMEQSGTSTNIENVFCSNPSVKGFQIRGSYTTMQDTAVDGCTGVAYDLSYGEISCSGLGCESPNADVMIKSNNALVTIDNSTIAHPSKDTGNVFQVEVNSNILVENCRVANYTGTTDASGKLVHFNGTKCSCSINSLTIAKKFKYPSYGDSSTSISVKRVNGSLSQEYASESHMSVIGGSYKDYQDDFNEIPQERGLVIAYGASDINPQTDGHFTYSSSVPINSIIYNTRGTGSPMFWRCISKSGSGMGDCTFDPFYTQSGGSFTPTAITSAARSSVVFSECNYYVNGKVCTVCGSVTSSVDDTTIENSIVFDLPIPMKLNNTVTGTLQGVVGTGDDRMYIIGAINASSSNTSIGFYGRKGSIAQKGTDNAKFTISYLI